MAITDNGGFKKEQTDYMRRKTAFQAGVVEDVDKVSRQTMLTIKRIMPKRDGRAAATWGVFTPEYIIRFNPNNLPMPDEAIWRVIEKGMTIRQGARLRPYNYIEDLNAGSSAQAPALFLDVAEEQAADDLLYATLKRTGLL